MDGDISDELRVVCYICYLLSPWIFCVIDASNPIFQIDDIIFNSSVGQFILTKEKKKKKSKK